MPQHVVHVIVTEAFAGTERYVAEVSKITADRGREVSVVGGSPVHMPIAIGSGIRWLPGGHVRQALASVRTLPSPDVLHVHLTAAEVVGVLCAKRAGARLFATRHIARHRGSSPTGRIAAPIIRHRVDRQFAISEYVRERVDGLSTVLYSGVASSSERASLSARTVLLCQRLEPEKDAATALRGWAASGLPERGWSLRVAGDGHERKPLEALTRALGMTSSVQFLGHVSDVKREMLDAQLLLAPTGVEALGMTVLEAMSLGLPVVAAAAGGHLETVGGVPGALLFPPGVAGACAAALRQAAALPQEALKHYANELQGRQRRHFDVSTHVDRLLQEYER